MSKHLAARWALVLALVAPVAAMAQASPGTARSGEPSIDDIYQAANGGRLVDAEAMLARVLAAHPASAKAHFVHAELLSKEGKLGAAKAELSKARELAPGLPFARPEAVSLLTQRVDAAMSSRAAERSAFATSASAASDEAAAPAPGIGTPAKIGIVVMLLAAGVFMFRRLGSGPSPAAARATSAPAGSPPSYASWPSGYAPAPQNPGYATATPPAAAPASSGLGGALMTGAAMGLGAVAVEEAFRHFSHRGTDRSDEAAALRDGTAASTDGRPAFENNLGPDANAQMGGEDFGITDAGSWDDGGGGGGVADGGSDW